MNIEVRLKQIENSEQALAEERKALQQALEKEKKRDAKLQKLVETSGFDSPRELVMALIEKYNLRVSGRHAAATKSGAKRRKRTTVTAELRDEIKQKVEEVGSMNSVAKEIGISYAVVSKIWNGQYDHL